MDVKDSYVNQAYLSVVESAANTLTFSKLETGVSIYEKVGWLINRIDYSFDVTAVNFAATDDAFMYGLSVADSFTYPQLQLASVLDYNNIKRIDFGTAANALLFDRPISKDFSNLKGGGLLVPPNPIYIYALGSTLGSVMTLQARMFYTVIKLKAEDFWELVEQRRMIGA